MKLADRIKNSEVLKNLALKMLMPKGQSRPRFWVKVFIHPFIIKKGKGASIRRNTRIDIFPNNACTLGKQSTIEDFCTINNAVGNINIGKNTRIGLGSVLIGPVNIGDDVRLAQNIVVSALNHNYQDVTTPISEQGVETQHVYIGDETWIGANSVILQGVFIGKHCVIGAGSVVTKNIPSYSVVAGNPARIIKKFNEDAGTWDKVNN